MKGFIAIYELDGKKYPLFLDMTNSATIEEAKEVALMLIKEERPSAKLIEIHGDKQKLTFEEAA